MASDNFLLIFLLMTCSECSLYDWFGWGSTPTSEVTANGVPLIEVPYEELVPEEKFLIEANKLTGMKLSDMDVCRHKVIMKIKASCASLSDEELARLSVNLLNCQRAVEGKSVFPCTDSMSLKACTKDMDSEAYNAYHTISNRARAVCYATRQDHFRTLSELAVNKLMLAARDHVNTLNSVQENQQKMEETSSRTLQKVRSGAREVLAGNTAILATQNFVMEKVNINLKIIQEGSTLLKRLSEDFSKLWNTFHKELDGAYKKLENTNLQIDKDQIELREYFKNLSSSLEGMISKIEEGSVFISHLHDTERVEIENSLNRLKEINDSIEYISKVAQRLRQVTEEKLSYVSYFIGENGETLEQNLRVAQQLCCLILCMIISGFLQLPLTCRLIILIVAPINLYLTFYSDLNHLSVEVSTLYTGFTLATLVYLITKAIVPYLLNELASDAKEKPTSETNHRQDSFQKAQDSFQKADRFFHVHKWLNDKESSEKQIDLRLKQAEENDPDRGSESSGRLNGNPAFSIAESNASGSRSPCLGFCRNGTKCKRYASQGTLFCSSHLIRR